MRNSKLLTIFILFSLTLIIGFGTTVVANDLPNALKTQLSSDGSTALNAQPLRVVINDPTPPAQLRHIPAPAALITAPQGATASFVIDYIPNGGTDTWGEPCYTFPETAKSAFNAAANIWANTITSSVPISINACWANLGSSSILGYSGGGSMSRDFPSAPLSNTWYSASLANALSGFDRVVTNHDMHITYNSNFSWYYGIDGNTPIGQHDLMTVVLHEIAHGLNFSGTMSCVTGVGTWGFSGSPNIYDRFMFDGSGTALTSYITPSIPLCDILKSNDIWFQGPRAIAANSGQRVKMYAPTLWADGSSFSHLDYTTFNNTSNQLMVYAISAGESIHDPGGITKGLLADLGWTIFSVPSGPTRLYNRVTVSNLFGATDEKLDYYIAVPGGATSLTIKTWGGSGDADIYVRYGNVPTTLIYDHRSWGVGNNETIVIINPQAGNWYVSVNGNTAFSGVNLKAEFIKPTNLLLFIPAMVANSTQNAQWGTRSYVCCSTASTTFSLTSGGVNRSSFMASCSSTSTWEGYARTTHGSKSFTFLLSSGNNDCGSLSGSFSYPLEKGYAYIFVATYEDGLVIKVYRQDLRSYRANPASQGGTINSSPFDIITLPTPKEGWPSCFSGK